MANVYDGVVKPIPAFYCCYLLRSTVRHSSLYIGSTPHPPRRLAQHNGVAKGGARKTANDKRPWEMTVIVEGFTSRVAALQFEWAWQKPGLSRHLDPNQDESNSTEPQPHADSTRQAKPRARGPARSLKKHIENLHALLRSTYFSHWPLKVRFFSADAYQLWRIWSDRVNGAIPKHIGIILDGGCADDNQPGTGNPRVGSVQQIQPDYSKISGYLEKAAFRLDDPGDLRCSICRVLVDPKDELVVVCPQERCYCINHLLCLSARFLDSTRDPERLVPMSGTCPECRQIVEWPLVMQELTLRNRGKKELEAVLRKKKRSDGRTIAAQSDIGTAAVETRGSLPSADTQTGWKDGLDENNPEDFPLDEDWIESLAPESDSEMGDPQRPLPVGPSRVEIVIEDSDCDE
ncbi:structure-specific endonuclease subunit slx1 [Aspergillus avenaceus]|uniref:Structure-specific endonuclease subunit slx1 n=1 Tax=Aspergillus avenaceus TaxID=36643 RepID=A0A5N6TVI2_ASPAV|nr:structure-specific endonuclease subunit slx1 [Aspergillus avenaceus]